MEALISSVSPFALMLGKVMGVGAVGLLQIGIWAGTASLLSTFRVEIAGWFGAPAAAMPIPTMTPALLAVFLLFFVLGFLLYSAAYAAIGAMCNTMQEAQQANMPVTMCIAAGLVCMLALLSEPNGVLARRLSLVPFLAPFVTPVRYSLSPMPARELLLSAVTTTLGMLAIVWVASRIYRVGILMYGKKPTLPELLRWVRTG